MLIIENVENKRNDRARHDYIKTMFLYKAEYFFHAWLLWCLACQQKEHRHTDSHSVFHLVQDD